MSGPTYYVERHASGVVGNCMLWWRTADDGYACDIREARVWTEKEVRALLAGDRGAKYTAWRKDEIDRIAALHVDVNIARQLPIGGSRGAGIGA